MSERPDPKRYPGAGRVVRLTHRQADDFAHALTTGLGETMTPLNVEALAYEIAEDIRNGLTVTIMREKNEQ